VNKYKFERQFDSADCGPACLKMVAGFYGKDHSLDYLREQCYLTKEGVSLLNISDAAEQIGFKTYLSLITFENLVNDCPIPCILHWDQNHFVVLYNVREQRVNLFSKNGQSTLLLTIADPAHGIVTIDRAAFETSWLSGTDQKGAVLVLEPTLSFYSINSPKESTKHFFLLKYLKPYKRYIIQLIIGMIAASLISLAFPFLTQLLIDIGVGDKNISIVYAILLSQLFLFLGSTAIGIIRSWLILHINTRISLNIISDFLIKLLKLPIKFFDSKTVGDLSQRINDHHRIETFLTTSLLSFIFSIFNICIFTFVLAYYNLKILLIFLILSAFGVCWILFFQKKRKTLDYKRFSRNKDNSNKLYEMITGMQEIKLFGAENAMRWDWEKLQVKYFNLNVESLSLEQFQQTGFLFFNQLKNILVSCLAAYEVINNQITLGTLISISFIIGQTNSPIEQFVGFITAGQDARLSMKRLQEIHDKQDEEVLDRDKLVIDKNLHEDIILQNLSFQYEGPNSSFVLKDVNLTIPKNKVTAIVGSSGSGKSTLLKLLLQYYKPTGGNIFIGENSLNKISPKDWRKKCGTVMQDGYIFYDTIANNIALGYLSVDEEQMDKAIRMANLSEFVTQLPLHYATKIGSSGIGLSGGQKQRIFIARAVYKNPQYIFFDEATSSLDANNEKTIIDNLNNFFENKTVIIVAHRLSTVKNAHQIVVLEEGRIIECGNHQSLIKTKGKYFELVKNQLELGD
jgi:ATP-binding cassette subfamily B protein